MSHTSTIEGVVVTDVDALRAAVSELKSNGIKCDLLENAIPRAYYADQKGMGQAPYVVKLHDSRFDVGVYRTEDNKGYEFRTDLHAGIVGAVLGDGNGYDGKSQLAKLNRLYVAHAATRQAVRQGYKVTRVNNADGSIQLRMSV